MAAVVRVGGDGSCGEDGGDGCCFGSSVVI